MTTTRPDLSPLSLAVDRAMTAAKVLDWEAFDRSDKTLPADVYLMDPVPCLGCKSLTYGCFSYGGAHLRSVCRPCKSAADRQEELQLTALVGAMDQVMVAMGAAPVTLTLRPEHHDREDPEPFDEATGPCDDRYPGHSERERCDGLDVTDDRV